MSSNRNWLGIAEYVCVASSAVGSAFAFVFQQAIYGLAPVSLSLLLNLMNRRRLEELCQHSSISTEVQQLKSSLNSLSAARSTVKQDVQNLVPRQELTALVSMVEELEAQQNGLRLSLVPLQSRLDDLIQQFNKRPELEQIESLAVVIAALKQCIDGLPQPERFQQHSTELQQQVERALTQESTTSERVERLEQAIALLQQQLLELH
ncbi:MAG TPA: hypothetical protein V6D35_23945 [Candidatus Sericytochromatia bacterium]|jgi:chromosome segregation ATPase